MKLYLIQLAGIRFWYGTQADANAGKRQHGVPWAEQEVPTDKPSLLDFLNENANRVPETWGDPSHPANADPDRVVKDINEDIAPERAVSYTETTVKLDELVANSPLAQRLTWASLALEDARGKLFPVEEAPRGWKVAETATPGGTPDQPVDDDELFG